MILKTKKAGRYIGQIREFKSIKAGKPYLQKVVTVPAKSHFKHGDYVAFLPVEVEIKAKE